MSKFYVPYLLKGSKYGQEEMDILKEILFNSQTLSCGLQRDLFEKEFASYVGSKYAFSLTSCTDALEFASYLVGFNNGDEVIATPLTYQASIQNLLTKPVKVKFCDINPNSLGVDINSIERLLTSRTKCLFVTHYGGYMNDMTPLMNLARKYKFFVIEDCAHALGSKYKGQYAGTTADISCFSFHSSKNISTLGEGGMITFNNDRWAEIIKNIRGNEPDCIFIRKENKFGKYTKHNLEVFTHEKNAFFENCTVIYHEGTNSTLSEPAAAVGRCQLKKLDLFNAERAEIAQYYNRKLESIEELRIQKVSNDIIHAYHLYAFFVNNTFNINRNEFISYLYDSGIEIILRYFPLHLLPEWRYCGSKYGQCPITEKIWFEELVNLPCYPGITEKQLNFMFRKIKEGVLKCKKRKKLYFS